MPHKPQPLSSTAWLLFVGAGGGDGGGGEGGGGGDGGAASVQAICSSVPLDCCEAVSFLYFLSPRSWDAGSPYFPDHAPAVLDCLELTVKDMLRSWSCFTVGL